MKVEILDSREEGNSKCFLSRMTLQEYINGLPSTYQDYEVQREIVSNVYLDNLVDTVLKRKHIPPIVLVVESEQLKQQKNTLEIKQFKILDGLQRTFRLQAIRSTMDYAFERVSNPVECLQMNKFKFSRQFSSDLRKNNSNTQVLRSILEALCQSDKDNLNKTFSENVQWFEIWSGLTPNEEVSKMLTLNAGHKPVKTRHQLELLFLNLLPILRAGEGADFQLVREKEVSATQFSKNRECGNFHFAHIVTSLLSMYEGEPVATTTGLIKDIQNCEYGLDEYGELITPEFLSAFVKFLVKLDKAFADQYGEVGVTWMGREVSLAGLFGAIGQFAEKSQISRQRAMDILLAVLNSKPKIFNLQQFEVERNNLDLSKVNIGNANRAAVFSAISEVLCNHDNPPKVDWHKHFRSEGV